MQTPVTHSGVSAKRLRTFCLLISDIRGVPSPPATNILAFTWLIELIHYFSLIFFSHLIMYAIEMFKKKTLKENRQNDGRRFFFKGCLNRNYPAEHG